MSQFKNQIAATGNFHRILNRARKIGKQLRHFFLSVKILAFIEVMGTPFVGKNFPFGNTGSRFMGGKFFLGQKLYRMSGNHRQLQFVCQFNGMPQILLHAGMPCTLNLDIEVVRKNRGPSSGTFFSIVETGRFESHPDIALFGAREGNQSHIACLFRQLFKPFDPDFRPTTPLVFQP